MNSRRPKKPQFDFNEFSDTARTHVDVLWKRMNDDQRRELGELFSLIPHTIRPLRDVLRIVSEQYTPVLKNKHRVAIVGPANSGKSTLYNRMLLRKGEQAETGPLPGVTKEAAESDVSLFNLVDTPGADAVGETGDNERRIALESAAGADFLIIVFDATHGVTRHELEIFETLRKLDKPYVVLLNKIDMVKGHVEEAVESAAQALNLDPEQVIITVATRGYNVGRVVLAVAKAEPALLAAMGKAMPQYRRKLAWQRIMPAAVSSAVVGLTPIPIADVIPLLGVQTGLVLSIARIYGRRMTPRRAQEVATTFGVGFAARLAFQQISKLGGIPGYAVSAAVAGAATLVMGVAAVNWFERGEKPTQEWLNSRMREITGVLVEKLQKPGKTKLTRSGIRGKISDAMKQIEEKLNK